MEAFMIQLENINYKNILFYPPIFIHEGKTTFITGPSGSGKSTLLKIINGTVDPLEGAITFNGRSIHDYDRLELRKDYILCGQSVFLFEESVRENFQSFAKLRGHKPLTAIQMQEFLTIACSDAKLDDLVTSMSGGERQRIYIALCLALVRHGIMLDEPTSALDDTTADQLINNLTQYCVKHNFTLIIVSHNETLSKKYGSDQIEIENIKGVTHNG